MRLFAAERFVVGFIALLFVVDAALIAARGISVDYAGYFLCVFAGAGVFLLGQFYRRSGRDDRIAAALMSGGLFILFTLAASIFNYMFLPIAFPTIDHVLFAVDAAFGYSWKDIVIVRRSTSSWRQCLSGSHQGTGGRCSSYCRLTC